VFSIKTDFSGDETLVIPSRWGRWPHLSQWTPDGTTLLFWGRILGGTWSLPSDGNGTLTELANTEANERWGVVSPDGDFIAYVADEQGVMEVFVQPYPVLGPQIQVSNAGGSEPLWSHDGATLFLRYGEKVYASTFDSETMAAGEPQIVFEGDYNLGPPGHQHYDVSRDSQWFLMIKEGRRFRPQQVRVIRNWGAVLRTGPDIHLRLRSNSKGR
jgi:hypothetical protein